MISIVIYSSDYYQDCWDPFFLLFKKYFPMQDDYELILITNTVIYKNNNLEVTTVNAGLDTPWSLRLRLGLEKAKNELIFLIGDDFFLLDYLNSSHLNKFIELINNSKGIDHLRFLHNPGKFKVRRSNNKELDIIEEFTKYRFLYAPGLWKKEKLTKYIVDFESPFMSEKMGTYRSWIHNDQFYCLSDKYLSDNDQFYKCGTSGVIAKGKWEAWAVPQLEKEKLGIDFSIRGIKDDYGSKSSIWKARKNQLKQPISTMKSIWSVFALLTVSVFTGKIFKRKSGDYQI